MALTFVRLAVVNEQRCRRWHGSFPDPSDPWTGADWSNAMQGEAGEAGNVVKKLRRLELGLVGNRGAELEISRAELIERLAGEIADTAIYLDLLATYYGIDLGAAVVRKFNQVSDELGLPERLEVA